MPGEQQARFLEAEARVLDRYGVAAERHAVSVPCLDGQAHVLSAGQGPPVLLVLGAGPPIGTWAPLMAELGGFTLHAVELPGMGLTRRAPRTTGGLRRLAVDFLDQVIEALALRSPPVIAQSMGGLWSFWLALERPARVPALCAVGCPALLLGTSAPFPLRLASRPGISRLVQRLDPPSERQVDRFVRLAGEDFSRHQELARLFLAHERLPGNGDAFFELVRAAVRLRGARPQFAVDQEQLSRITQPVRLIWADGDPFGPAEAGRRAARILPQADFHLVPGGHAPWVNEPSRVAELVGAFVHRHSDSPAPRP